MHFFCVDNLVDVCVGAWQMYAFICHAHFLVWVLQNKTLGLHSLITMQGKAMPSLPSSYFDNSYRIRRVRIKQ